MLRLKNKSPYSDRDLSGQEGTIARMLWQRGYLSKLMKSHPDIFLKRDANTQLAVTADVDGQPELPWVIARKCVENPTRLFDVLMGPDREPSFLHSLPNGAMTHLLQHVVDLYSGVFEEELQGGLAASGPSYNADTFLDSERVKKRFFNAFKNRVGI